MLEGTATVTRTVEVLHPFFRPKRRGFSFASRANRASWVLDPAIGLPFRLLVPMPPSIDALVRAASRHQRLSIRIDGAGRMVRIKYRCACGPTREDATTP